MGRRKIYRMGDIIIDNVRVTLLAQQQNVSW